MIKNKQQGFSLRNILIIIFFIAIGVYFYQQKKVATEAESQARAFITTPVTRGDISQTVLASGSLEANKLVKVGAQVSGEIRHLYVKIGDKVKKGDKIAEINASTQKNTRDSAAANLAASKAALNSAQAELNQAKQNYERQKKLFQKGATAKENFDNATANLKSREAALAQAKANVRRSQLELDSAGVNLSHTTVSAPMDGVVISVAVEEGQSINAVQNIPTLVTIAQTDKMTVKAQIAEADINTVKVGMPAYFTLLSRDSPKFTGVLNAIDPAPLYISDNRSSGDNAVFYYGKMEIANPKGALRIGMTANLVITVAEAKNVLFVPLTALQTGKNGEDEVQILMAGKPQSRAIKIGLQDSLNAEIVNGLTEGEEVIISRVTKDSGKTPWD